MLNEWTSIRRRFWFVEAFCHMDGKQTPEGLDNQGKYFKVNLCIFLWLAIKLKSKCHLFDILRFMCNFFFPRMLLFEMTNPNVKWKWVDTAFYLCMFKIWWDCRLILSDFLHEVQHVCTWQIFSLLWNYNNICACANRNYSSQVS